MYKKLSLSAVLLAVTLGLAGCGADSSSDATGSDTGSSHAGFNDADVAFATGMIPHHAQALTMVDMTQGRTLSPQVADLAEAIRNAQTPEIEQMSQWLTDWGQPIPETMRDHSNADSGMDMGDTNMPGMMTQQEMDDLDNASDAEFEDMWLSMMVQHHQGAVEMATAEVENGEYQPAIDLAKSIIASQNVEIEQMQKLLG